jgi:hypothetical protein
MRIQNGAGLLLLRLLRLLQLHHLLRSDTGWQVHAVSSLYHLLSPRCENHLLLLLLVQCRLSIHSHWMTRIS